MVVATALPNPTPSTGQLTKKMAKEVQDTPPLPKRKSTPTELYPEDPLTVEKGHKK